MIVDGSTLTPAQLVALVEADHLSVDAGLELLDSSDDGFIEDISGDFIADGSSVDRAIYRTVHGGASLKISRDLQWGNQRLRPYLLLSSDGSTWYRWSLGVFLPSVPDRVVAESPPVWEVACFDKLDILNTPHAATYSLAAGENVIDAVVALITSAGESKINIESSAAVTASTVVLSIVDQLTTLQVCNELLNSVNYRSLSVDREGWYVSAPYVAPGDLGTVWAYSADSASTTVGEHRTATADYYQAANTVIGVNDSPEQTTIPVEGDGIHTMTNQSDGPTSIDARGGRVIRRIISGNYVDQDALVAAVERIMANEKRVTNYADISVSTNPVHGHYDVVNLRDDAIPVNGRYLVTNWTMPLDGADMQLTLRAV